MTEQFFNILLINNFSSVDTYFLLSNQTHYNNLELLNSCVFCESFFIKFINLFNLHNYYIYINLNCICTYDTILIFNVSYFYAI